MLIVNQILTPTLQSTRLSGPHRVLAVDKARSIAWCIPLPQSQKNGRRKGYVLGPRAFALDALESALSQDELRVARFTPPGHWLMSDEDYVDEITDESERLRRRDRLKKRDRRWAMIKPIIEQLEGGCFRHSLIRKLVLEQAGVQHVSAPTVYRTLHVYWANGSTLNGLFPESHRCGAKGQQRRQYQRRQSRLPHQNSATTKAPFFASQRDKDRLALGYTLISPKRTPQKAYTETCMAFWSSMTIDELGGKHVKLLPPDQRPTPRHFRYWGAKTTGSSARAVRLGLGRRAAATHRGGSARDLAAAVGQVAMFDATSADVYLTSMRSRLEKLPPMTRSLVMDVRSTAYMGVYCGWDHPSPRTGLRTIYCAATNKVELCKRFDITIGEDDWPGMLFRVYLVDNGELKAASVTEAEQQVGFGMEFARTYHGSSKGTVETQHRTDHKKVDHQLAGTTHGRRRERGMPHPADDALLNYWEYMRELLLWILEYNQQEVKHLAPTAMLNAGVRPTRINVFKWLRDHGQRADIPCDLDQLRALTLPEWRAVIQYNGIVVKSPDGNRNLGDLRFFCEELRGDPRFVRASTERKVLPVSVRFEPENIAELWLPSSRGLLRVANVVSDREAMRLNTVADMEHRYVLDAPVRRQRAIEQEQNEVDTALRRDAITIQAARELQAEIQAAKKKPSKTSQRKNLRRNAIREQELVEKIHHPGPSRSTSSTSPIQSSSPTGDSAAENAVDAFLGGL